MRLATFILGLVLSLAAATASMAQQAWVQIEAQPSLREGEERARAYAGVFPNVNGFTMTTGWYAIALGPFSPEEAERQLSLLRGERLIPSDSYIAFGERFAQRFWPVGAATLAPAPEPSTDPDIATAEPLPQSPPDETPTEARRSEALLTREERMRLQEALQWDGFYTGAIDGAFGAGTRRSMAAWQTMNGQEPSGILTTAQRAALIEAVAAQRAALGLETIREDEAGIEITLPTALVEFDRYQPPFVHFKEKDGSGFRVLLISQEGDQKTLSGLYDIMQTLEIVPLSGERQLNRTNFVLSGKNDNLQSHTEVTESGGMIKGFTLAWRPEDGDKAVKVLEAMKAGFRPIGDSALNEGLGAPLAEERADLLSGLEIRRPILTRSGFYADQSGLVVTTDEAVAACGRVTLDGRQDVDLVLRDEANGLAVLRPQGALSPRAHARFADQPGRINSEVAVAGFSYGDALDEAVLSFGTLSDTRGLNGELNIARLDLKSLEGDAGGPVLNASGDVIGMMMPRNSSDGRVLPDDVGFALNSSAIKTVLAAAGLADAEPAGATETSGTMAPEDLTLLGRDLTVLVSCWQ